MKKILTIVTIVSGMFFSSLSFATESTDYELVTLISIGSTGNLYIYTAGDERDTDPANCQNLVGAKSTRYALAADAPTFNLVYAQILTAMAAGFEVKLAIEDEGCLEGSGIVARAAMRP